AADLQLLQPAAEDLLALAARIDVGGVEEVDPGLDRLAQDGQARVLVQRPVGHAAEAHAAEAEPRDLRSRRSHAHVFHRVSSFLIVRASRRAASPGVSLAPPAAGAAMRIDVFCVIAAEAKRRAGDPCTPDGRETA